MSKVVEAFLAQNPLLSKYVQMGLVNITSLAQYLKENNSTNVRANTVASIAMSIRRHIAKLPATKPPSPIPQNIPLNLVVRSNITELIFAKDKDNRSLSRRIFQEISSTKDFSCLVEGEKEVVLITDRNLHQLMTKNNLQKTISHQTTGLGFISVDLPIRLREVVGVYSLITSTLAVAQIPIHSFHTIGGEILILVKNEDLISAQEVLSTSLVGTMGMEKAAK